MDRFERQLTQLMHDEQGPTAFEPRHRERLRAGVQARRRVRAAQRAAGAVLTVAGFGLCLFLWPHADVRDEPSAPHPWPATSPTTGPAPTPSLTPSAPASGVTTSAPPPEGTTAPGDTPSATSGGTPSSTPSSSSTATSTPDATRSATESSSGSSTTSPPSAPVTNSPDPSNGP
ncbi:hypothetical protein [Streptomyces sp. NPDC086777]|uniref:hypothetical protein n=1 Tax=Streptomyces sp. NPDC086777 TaxID=3154866 RepID=UPI00344B8EB0